MKKAVVISLITLVVLVAVFVGCTTQNDTAPETTAATEAQVTTQAETAAPTTAAITEEATTVAKSDAKKSEEVTLEKARQIAVKDAGIKGAEISFTKAKLDTDDGVKIYEIEFTYNGNEYEYDINAKTGTIIEKSKEPVDND